MVTAGLPPLRRSYAAYLLRRGLPAADLLKEAQSYDTIGNAYFSLLTHALPAGWRCALRPAAAPVCCRRRRLWTRSRPAGWAGLEPSLAALRRSPAGTLAAVTSELHCCLSLSR